MKVFVDTSAFYALASATDEFHHRAREIYKELLAEDAKLLTSSYVLVESFALIQSRLGFEVLRAFVNSIQDLVEIVWVDEDLHWKAWKSLQEKKTASFVDCTSFLIAREKKARVFAFDEDFAEEGFTLL